MFGQRFLSFSPSSPLLSLPFPFHELDNFISYIGLHWNIVYLYSLCPIPLGGRSTWRHMWAHLVTSTKTSVSYQTTQLLLAMLHNPASALLRKKNWHAKFYVQADATLSDCEMCWVFFFFFFCWGVISIWCSIEENSGSTYTGTDASCCIDWIICHACTFVDTPQVISPGTPRFHFSIALHPFRYPDLLRHLGVCTTYTLSRENLAIQVITFFFFTSQLC